MLKKRLNKIIVFFMVLVTVMNVSLAFENLPNGHFLQFGDEAKAATVYYYYDKYTVSTEWYLDTSNEFVPDLASSYKIWDAGGSGYNVRVPANAYYKYFDTTTGEVHIGQYGLDNPRDYKEGIYMYIFRDNTWAGGESQYHEDRHADPGQSMDRYLIDSVDQYGLYGQYAGYTYSRQREIKGSLLQSNLIALDGTYPDNGKHTDGYWYVKKGANQVPKLYITSPSPNTTISKANNCTPSMIVSDSDGDTLTCKYYIDSAQNDTKIISNTATAQVVTFNTLDTSTLSDGIHKLVLEVSDGTYAPVSQSVDVIVDNNPPIISSNPSFTSDDTSITISG